MPIVAKGKQDVKRVMIRPSMLRQIKNWLIFHFATGCIRLVGTTPACLVSTLGHLIGRASHFLAAHERGLAREHLALAMNMPVYSRRNRLIVRGIFRELGINAVEICRFLRNPNNVPEVIVPTKSREILDGALSADNGVIFVTAHMGNWEMMAATLAKLGYPISTVARESYDDRFTQLMEKARAGAGITAIYRGRPGSSAAMLKALRGNRVLGFLIDQDTKVPSTFVPFFGHLASTPTGAAVFAHRTDAKVVLGTIRRTVPGKHVIEISDIELGVDVPESTKKFTAELEHRIRKHPSQWIWFHRRWKTRPDQ